MKHTRAPGWRHGVKYEPLPPSRIGQGGTSRSAGARSCGSGARAALGLRGLGSRVESEGLRVQGLRLTVDDLGPMVESLGLRDEGVGLTGDG